MNLQDIIQNISYESHPAYKQLKASGRYDDFQINKIITNLDSLYRTAKIDKKNTTEEVTREFEKLENICLAGTDNVEVSEVIKKIISLAKSICLTHLNYYLQQVNYQPFKLSDADLKKFELLKTNGYCKLSFEESDKRKIKYLGQKILDISRSFYSEKDTWRGARSISSLSEAGYFFTGLLQKYQIQKIVSNYKQTEMSLLYMGVDYSHPRQSWFKDCYSDLNLVLPKTNYYHFDDDLNVVKVMIYLNDVHEKNGPFCILEGYDFEKLSPIRWCLASALDHGVSKLLKNTTSPFDYYRPMFKSYRELFMSLPKALQITTHFGDDFLPNSPEESLLMKNTQMIIGEAGSSIIFDGQRVIHKGSTSEEGERLGLQIGFIEKKHFSTKELLIKNLKSQKPFSTIGRLVKRISNDKII